MGKAARLKMRHVRRALERVGVVDPEKPSTPVLHALSPWAGALEADNKRLDEPWGDPEPEWKAQGYTLTRRSYMSAFARIAKEKSEWAGLPVQLPNESLTVEPSYFAANKQDELNRIMSTASSARVCTLSDHADQTVLRNHFWSDRLRCDIVIWQEGKKFSTTLAHTRQLDYDLNTLGCVDAWQLETEYRAMECLRQVVEHHQFRSYFLTGAFLERSRRSGVFYMFRRLRPTVALSGSTGSLRILAALCLHPIAYYQNSFAGAMCPTDDVMSHLMLMRGDEYMFWKRANQHHPARPEAGL